MQRTTSPKCKAVIFNATRRSPLFPLVLALLLAIFGLPPAHGQASNGGTVSGRVLDTAGLVIPNATLTLTSISDGHVITVQSNASGEYIFNGVAIGAYTLVASAKTFSKYTVQDVTVDAASSVTIEATLRPASDNTVVTVEASNVAIDTTSATIQTVIDPQLVSNLPLDGNNVIETAALLPGVTNINAPSTFTSDTGGPTFNVSGARANQNLLLLDGTLWNNLYSNTGLNFPPRQGLQEVSVILNNYKAQYGRNVGSVFNVLTKSGTNSIHGQIWEFVQNTMFNAADYLSHLNTHIVSNQFGANIGGPVVIPHVFNGRDKLFFDLTFQDLRAAGFNNGNATTLELAERGLNPDGVTPRPCTNVNLASPGNYCASFLDDSPIPSAANNFAAPATISTTYTAMALTQINTGWQVSGHTGNSPCLTDPVGKAPNYEINVNCFNPVSVAMLALQQVPTLYIAGATLPTAVTLGAQPRSDYDGLARVDWILPHHTIAARYYQTSVNDHTANGVSAGGGLANYDIDLNVGGINAGILDDTWVITPNILNTARVAYKRYVYDIAPLDTRSLTSFGAVFTYPFAPSLPKIVINSRFTEGTGSNYSRSVNEDIEGDDFIIWTHGSHNFQAGAEFLGLQYVHRFDSVPSLSFNNTFSGLPAADYMMGLINVLNVGNPTYAAANQHDLYMYAQDDWRLTPRLTLNLGLRYELPFAWYNPDGESATFIPGYQSQIFPTAPPNYAFVGDKGVEKSLVGTDYRNLAPRLGLSYDLFGNGKMTVRAGYGIFYDAINALVVGVSEPYHYTANYTSPGVDPTIDQSISAPLGYNGINMLTPIPQNYKKGLPPPFTTPYSITFPDQNFQTPYTQAMNFGFQRVLGQSTLEVNYVGRLGRHLALGYDLNPAIVDCSGAYFQLNPSLYCSGASTSNYAARVRYPNFNNGGSGALDYMTIGSSSYNAAQAIYTVRAKASLTMILSYTFSKSMDDSSNGTGISNSTDQATVSVHNAVSDYDARQILNMGGTYHLPKYSGTSRLAGAILNNWVMSGIFTARTGNPFSCTLAGDQSYRNEKNEFCEFTGPYIPFPSNRHRAAKVLNYVNLANVGIPVGGTYGNVPRNFFRGPAFMLPTIDLQRTIDVGPGMRLIFRADAINAFNTPNLGLPNLGQLSGTAGKNTTFDQILATAGNNGVAGTNGRRVQLSGTFQF